MSLSHNDLILFCPNQRNISAYNFKTGEVMQTFQGHYERVNACIFHPYRQELYSAASDNQILIWSSQEEISSNEQHDTVTLCLIQLIYC